MCTSSGHESSRVEWRQSASASLKVRVQEAADLANWSAKQQSILFRTCTCVQSCSHFKFAMSVADLSQESIKEIASYLDEFLPVPKGSYDNDSEQYWYYLAVTLRDEKKLSDEFKFDAHV